MGGGGECDREFEWIRVADPHHFNADLNPAFYFIADPGLHYEHPWIYLGL
jgi:hypothetical protein